MAYSFVIPDIANISDIFDNTTGNFTNISGITRMGRPSRPADLSAKVLIPLYSLIFVLALVGNALVILTLAQNRRMRTVTNVFLLNLSISDLLRALFCMPFTLIPNLMKNFIFGATMCVMIRYLQAVSVGVNCFTLVAISMERYFAICEPLKSRSWQTLSHSYRTIGVCWLSAGAIMIPIALFQRHEPMGRGRYRCTEKWTDKEGEKAYVIILDLVLLLFPMIIMTVSYGMIVKTLWVGIKFDLKMDKRVKARNGYVTDDDGETIAIEDLENNGETLPIKKHQKGFALKQTMRQTNVEKSRAAKKRVIRMLFVIVLEFFVCWTPLYVITTWIFFDYDSARLHIPSMFFSFMFLLSYVSSCTNPITYCFMHKKFRQGFLTVCKCPWRCRGRAMARRDQYSSYFAHSTMRTGTVRVTVYDRAVDSDEDTHV